MASKPGPQVGFFTLKGIKRHKKALNEVHVEIKYVPKVLCEDYNFFQIFLT